MSNASARSFDDANAISSGAFSWEGKRVLVTGGAGFVGSYLVEDLIHLGARVRVADDLSSGSLDNLAGVADHLEFVRADLRDRDSALKAGEGVDVVLHLAAKAFGMLFSMSHNYDVLRDNVAMVLNVLDSCLENNVERVLLVSSSCVYDDGAPIPTPELPVHEGLPESVNEGYGWAKRMLEIQGRYAYEQFGLPIAIVRPYNAYGGRYQWQGDASHVVPSLVKKVMDRNGPVVVWGSGEQVRDLLHARDFALGFRLATEQAVDCEPVNLAGGTTITLNDLVRKVADMAGLEIELEHDLSKQEGRRVKEADLTRLAAKVPAFRQTVSLEDGLADMLDWYARNLASGTFSK